MGDERKEKIKKIVDMIRNTDGLFALTGAGISTESGLPDFRSPGTGIWEKVDPIKTSSARVLQQNPRLFFKVGFQRFISLRQAQPNAGHFALAELEQLQLLRGLITQNIDGLHYKAGSRKIWEVHGHLRTGHCMECDKSFPFDFMTKQLNKGINPPVCNICQGVVRPDVVLFGDPLGKVFFEAEQAFARQSDTLMVLGSSLTVYPVASLPRHAKKLIIINLQPTPLDERADVVVRDKCAGVLTDILKLINNE